MSKSIENRIIQNQVDLIILEEGSFCSLNWLLREAHLDYSDYQKWKDGEISYLEDRFKSSSRELITSLQQAHQYANSQALEPSKLKYLSTSLQALFFCRSPSNEQLFTTLYEPAQNRMQMDLFFDSAPACAEYDLIQAIINNRKNDVTNFVNKLKILNPEKHLLFVKLLALENKIRQPKQPSHKKIDLLQNSITPLTFQILGRFAHDFLIPLWQTLCAEIAHFSFEQDNPENHLSFTAFKAFQWSDVLSSIEREQDWHAQPVLLFRYAESCFKLSLESKGMAHWFNFFSLYPELAKQYIKETCNPLLLADWQNFSELDPALESALFPAWIILNKPALLKNTSISTINSIKAFELTKKLICNDAHDLNQSIQSRMMLKKHYPNLFIHYMKINEKRNKNEL